MNTPPEVAIRLQRAKFNQALADADLAAIEPLLANNVVLVAGTDSALLSGRKAQLLAWKREFAVRERTIYLRKPETITLSPVAPIAFEHGHWEGSAAGGEVLASGVYTAKWRRMGADWVIEAELYLTTA